MREGVAESGEFIYNRVNEAENRQTAVFSRQVRRRVGIPRESGACWRQADAGGVHGRSAAPVSLPARKYRQNRRGSAPER